MTELVNGERSTTIKGDEYVKITGAVDKTYEDTFDLSVTGAVNVLYDDIFNLSVLGAVTHTYEQTLKTDIVGVAEIKSGAAMIIGGSSISFN